MENGVNDMLLLPCFVRSSTDSCHDSDPDGFKDHFFGHPHHLATAVEAAVQATEDTQCPSLTKPAKGSVRPNPT